MNDHIYTPENDSLDERIDAFRRVHQAWLNAEASLKYMDDSEGDWCYTLGERQEIEDAYEVADRSLGMATSAISQSELDMALSQGHLSGEEYRELIQHKRREDAQRFREEKLKNSAAEISESRATQRRRR